MGPKDTNHGTSILSGKREKHGLFMKMGGHRVLCHEKQEIAKTEQSSCLRRRGTFRG